MSAVGFTTAGLICEACGEPFSLVLGRAKHLEIKIEKLPDPFEAECPLCNHRATYPKSAIRTLRVASRL
jgi:hypothetical protein